ncbi:class F sortase [Micromonospora echinofusca]|uniref:Sortase n=1 Tax=Micromonospora echinofusca TaxID=47858 RepID=A0ABS3VKC3_MICEH|nr:class F sortase [Micromonospora echinofusca]MBO4204928.1 sortase [Micromonospora echinofusca]
MTVRNRGALAATAAGVAVLTVAGLVACASRPAGNVGSEEVRQLATASPDTGATGPAPTSVPVTRGDLPTAAATVPPVRLRIARIGVTATVDPVGVDPVSNEFEVPPSVDRIGWYRHGPGLEADTGSIVVAGHVDSAEQGAGAFFRLRELDRGDTVTATGSDGVARTYRVVAREEYPKTKIPLERYFARDGRPRLTLITCGGPFDAKARSYRDNVVVTAVPV